FAGQVHVRYNEHCDIEVSDIKPGKLTDGSVQRAFDSVVLGKISEQLPSMEDFKDDIWRDLLSDDHLDRIFKEFLIPHYTQFYLESCRKTENFSVGNANRLRTAPVTDGKALFRASFEKQLKYESALAGSLQFLLENKNFTELKHTFYNSNNSKQNAITIIKALSASNREDAYLNLENLNPR